MNTLINEAGQETKVSVCHDYDTARLFYEQMLSGEWGVDVITFGDGQTDRMIFCTDKKSPYFKESKLKRMKKSELMKLACETDLHFYDTDADLFTKQELISDLTTVSIEDFYRAEYAAKYWNNLDRDFISRGYCQGDAVAVKFHGDVLKKEPWLTETVINRTLWDTPFYCRLTVNDIEHDINEHIKDEYDYDAAEVEAILKTLAQESGWRERVLKFLIDNIPSQPSA
jgi:hypothetical protein